MTRRHIPYLRWIIGFMLMFSATICYLDRQTLSVVATDIKQEFNMTDTDYSNVVNSFLVSYAIMYTAGGWLMDRMGTRWGFALFISFWSIMGMLHAAARSIFHLGIFRFLLGVGEGANYPGSNKVTSEWFPPKERGTAVGLFNSGSMLGALLAPPMVAFVTGLWGWRMAFIVTGSLGFIWMALWLFLFYPVKIHLRLSDDERSKILEGLKQESNREDTSLNENQTISWKSILKLKETWGLILSRFFADSVGMFYIFWLFKYLREMRDFSLTDLGLFGWIPFLAADIGSIAGGYASSWLVKQGYTPIISRKRLLLFVALFMPLNAFVGLIPNSAIALTVISFGMFCHMAWIANIVTLVADTFPSRVVGTVSGFSGTGSIIGPIIFNFIAGRFIDAYHTYTHIFFACGSLHLIGTAFVYYAYKKNKNQNT